MEVFTRRLYTQTRPLHSSDIPILEAMAKASGFPYPDFSDLEAILVLADDADQPIMAVGAKRLVELYLWCGQDGHPAARLHGIRLLHEAMREKLREIGYDEANAFLPPILAQSFGKRLERTFQWVKNWPSWMHRL